MSAVLRLVVPVAGDSCNAGDGVFNSSAFGPALGANKVTSEVSSCGREERFILSGLQLESLLDFTYPNLLILRTLLLRL